VGTDVESNVSRYAFGLHELYDGISLVALSMGLFGVAEVIASARAGGRSILERSVSMRSMMPSRSELRQSILPILRGSAIGGFIGALPGAGVTIASFLSYAAEKSIARDRTRFGKGAIEGICSPEAANNAAAQTAFIPTLTIGIPGSAGMAIILGALMIHGIVPGPSMISEHPTVFWGLVASFWIGNLFLVVLNIPFIGLWVRLLLVPYRLLFPVVIALVCMGAFAINGAVFDVALVLIAGILGYGMRVLGYEPAPLLIGFVLGPLIEENFRRSMLLAQGDASFLLGHPVALMFLALSLGLLLWSAVVAPQLGKRVARLVLRPASSPDR
jgi:putative tricarboxylic transport membrane protein